MTKPTHKDAVMMTKTIAQSFDEARIGAGSGDIQPQGVDLGRGSADMKVDLALA